jgi:RNA polymerase subunit RPABC4/transcription elongation factor Spt4
MDIIQNVLAQIQPFLALFVALLAAFLTATWISAVIWTFRDIRSRTRDIFAQILATLLVLIFFPLFPIPGLILYYILRPRETLSEAYERTLEEEALLHGIEERLACPGCNRRIDEDFLFCPSCHTRLKKACRECGRQLHLKWSLCPYCGAAQVAGELPTAPTAVILPAREAIAAPRLAPNDQAALPRPPVVEGAAGPDALGFSNLDEGDEEPPAETERPEPNAGPETTDPASETKAGPAEEPL